MSGVGELPQREREVAWGGGSRPRPCTRDKHSRERDRSYRRRWPGASCTSSAPRVPAEGMSGSFRATSLAGRGRVLRRGGLREGTGALAQGEGTAPRPLRPARAAAGLRGSPVRRGRLRGGLPRSQPYSLALRRLFARATPGARARAAAPPTSCPARPGTVRAGLELARRSRGAAAGSRSRSGTGVLSRSSWNLSNTAALRSPRLPRACSGSRREVPFLLRLALRPGGSTRTGPPSALGCTPRGRGL